MLLPFSYPKLGQEWLRWRLSLVARPLQAVFDKAPARLGMASPPHIVALPSREPTLWMNDAGDLGLSLAGQKHVVLAASGTSGAKSTADTKAQWFPNGASAYWLAQAHALAWLPEQMTPPNWHATTRLLQSWFRHRGPMSAWSSAKLLHTPDVVGQRLVSLLRVLGQLPHEQDLALYQRIRAQVFADAQFLARAGLGGHQHWSRLAVLEGQCLFASSFDGLDHLARRLLPRLLREVHGQWDAIGTHSSADVGVSVAALVSLLNAYTGLSRLRSPSADEHEMLAELKRTIDQAARLLSITTMSLSFDFAASTRLAAFSGFCMPESKVLTQILDRAVPTLGKVNFVPGAPWTRAVINHHVGQVQTSVDVHTLALSAYNAVPRMLEPGGGAEHAFHAGLGAIEVASEAGTLIGGCGIGEDVSRWGANFRSTPAFSTMCLEGQDALAITATSSQGGFGSGFGSGFGNGLGKRSAMVPSASLTQHRVGQALVVELSHDGFSDETREIRAYRRLRLAQDASRIDGEDRFEVSTVHGGETSHAAVAALDVAGLRFQFAPNVRVVQDTKTRLILDQRAFGGPRVLWELVLTNGDLSVEPGIWFDEHGKAKQATNLAVTAPIRDGRCLIFWRLERLTPNALSGALDDLAPTQTDDDSNNSESYLP